MLRFALVAALACSVSPAFAGDPKHGAHSHGVVASYSSPINYRPNNGEGRLLVRSQGFSEANTKIVRSSTVGVTTGTSVLPGPGVTKPGRHSTGKLILVKDGATH